MLGWEPPPFRREWRRFRPEWPRCGKEVFCFQPGKPSYLPELPPFQEELPRFLSELPPFRPESSSFPQEWPRFHPEKQLFPLEKEPFQRENIAINSKSATCYFTGAADKATGGVGVGGLAALCFRTLLRMSWSFLASVVPLPSKPAIASITPLASLYAP
jgi:hypothetical protein